jgi:hypothetical protein
MSDAFSGSPADLDPDLVIEIEIPNKHIDQEHRSSFLDRFLSSFFDEQNIKWLLVIGAGIVFGSSLMLVTREWSHWPITLKYLTVLGYTAAGFCAAELCRKRLGLRTTSQVLHSLTLLLLPICFLSLSWMSSSTATQVNLSFVELLPLLVPAVALTWFASNRIFDFLLNGRQTTFVLSYQLLCVAGVIPKAGSALFAIALMLSLWLVFSAGVIKVNRHVFWLTEERRESRIFGFFPIALLGLQFLTLVGTKCLPAAPAEWLGFGCVLVALTVMATARTVADVFRQRTGDLLESLPWSVAIPMFCGLVLTSAGVMLSFNGFPHSYALIPTTALAAVLMAWSGHDTKHSGFVWMSLLFATMAYQFTPTLFQDFARQVRDSAATAVGEQKFPIAFYGLTYLPLLASIAWGSRYFRLRANPVCSRPMQQFTTIVSLALFALSVTNEKAMLVVSVVNVLTFFGLASIFRDRRYAMGSIAAIYAAALSIIPCLNVMPGFERINPAVQSTVLALVAALMTATRLPDHIVNSIPTTDGFLKGFLVRSDGTHRNLCQLSGCVVATALLGRWIVDASLSFGSGLTIDQLWQFGILLATFVLYTIRNPSYLAGLLTWAATGFAVLCYSAGPATAAWPLLNGSSNVAVAASVVGLLCLYVSGHLNRNSSLRELRKRLTTRNSLHTDAESESLDGWTRQTLAFVVPLCDLSLVTLGCLAVLYHIPLLLAANFATHQPSVLFATSAAVTWLIAAGAITKHRMTAVIGALIMPLWVSGMVAAAWPDSFSNDWSPTIWAIASGCCYLVAKRRESSVSSAVTRVNELWLLVIIASSCLSFVIPFRMAAGIVLAAFAVAHWRHFNAAKRTWLAITANIQCLYLAAAVGGLSGFVPSVLINANLLQAAPIMLLGTAISVAFFARDSDLFDRMIVQAWNFVLGMGIVGLIGLSFGSAPYTSLHCAIMLTGLTITALTDFTSGIRRQKVEHIWFSLIIPGLAALWTLRHGFIDVGNGASQCVLLGTAIACLITSRLCRKQPRYGIAAQPLRLIGQSLPALVVLLSVGKAVLFSDMHMPGLNNLAMFGSAAVYFHQALVTRQRRFAFASLGILNLSLMLLWNSLGLQDAQFYMVPVGLSIIGLVELMKRQLPQSSHDLLRYIGALTILVSPVFEIMGGSWLHLLTLMVFSVVIVLLAIGLRLKALMYTGTAFLLADLVAMVVRSTIDNPSLLWICGVVLGAAVIGLAAFCENHRDRLLQRIRFLSAELATWQ